MQSTNPDLIQIRRHLHQYPETAGEEAATAQNIYDWLHQHTGFRCYRHIGGHGLVAVKSFDNPGPTVLLRCELDALPIQERMGIAHHSRNQGCAHKCGHDGHMTILLGVAERLQQQPPSKGTVALLFQPAEETGEGAPAVLKDPQWPIVHPDWVFALHNVPGYPLGQILCRPNVMCAASRGMEITLQGTTAHAAEPENGNSPAMALAELIAQFSDPLSQPDSAQQQSWRTVVGARLGDKAFGVAPGDARLWLTLRSESDAGMATLIAACEQHTAEIAQRQNLQHQFNYEDVFPATVNHPQAFNIIQNAIDAENMDPLTRPFRWSEDFGHFTQRYPGALFGIGSGEQCADLHHPDYDFPDALIAPAVATFIAIINEIMANNARPN